MKAAVLALLAVVPSASAFNAFLLHSFQARAQLTRSVGVAHAKREGGPNPDILGNAPKTRPGNALAGSKSEADSQNRGLVFFALVFLANIWSFTIPVNLRRAHICQQDWQVEQRSSSDGLTSENCVTASEYRERLRDFYATCAETNTCVVFNFDVEKK